MMLFSIIIDFAGLIIDFVRLLNELSANKRNTNKK